MITFSHSFISLTFSCTIFTPLIISVTLFLEGKGVKLCCVKSFHLALEDVLWCGLLPFHIPHQSHTVWLMRSVFIVVVGGHQELRVLEIWREESGGRRKMRGWENREEDDKADSETKNGRILPFKWTGADIYRRSEREVSLPEGTSPDRWWPYALTSAHHRTDDWERDWSHPADLWERDTLINTGAGVLIYTLLQYIQTNTNYSYFCYINITFCRKSVDNTL